VVGLGYIAQTAVLPAFKNANKNSELAALISHDEVKLRKLSRKYQVRGAYTYDQFDACLESGEIDAVYIALPNHMHREYTIRAAERGVHVLCEKPMAVSEKDCREMIQAAEDYRVKLMVAYRLHFEESNLQAIKIAKSGRLGELRAFQSLFSLQAKEGDIRLNSIELGGGTLYDIGIYCINAARYLFRAEPVEVIAMSENNGEKRFREVDEMTSAVLRFPGNRLASFTSSFGAADAAEYRLVGTKGDLRSENAYEYSEAITHRLTVNGKETRTTYRRRDQFGPELLYFSDCILNNRDPEPSGKEGLADVRVIDALYRSMRTVGSVSLGEFEKPSRPSPAQEIDRPPVDEPELVHAESPSGR
jgi:predicted dehydrogenase